MAMAGPMKDASTTRWVSADSTGKIANALFVRSANHDALIRLSDLAPVPIQAPLKNSISAVNLARPTDSQHRQIRVYAVHLSGGCWSAGLAVKWVDRPFAWGNGITGGRSQLRGRCPKERGVAV